MRDDYRARSPDRGRHPDRANRYERDHQGRQYEAYDDRHQEQEEGYYRSRQGYSRSPPRQDFDHHRGNDAKREDEGSYGRGRDGRYEATGDDHARRDGDSRGSRHYHNRDHDYSGMYDDGQYREDDGGRYRDRYEDDQPREGYERRRHRQHGSRSHSRGRRARSRSESPSRDAGRPSDTVMLEGLPYSVSSNELRESLLRDPLTAEFPSIDVRMSSSRGNRRAFVQFETVDQAMAFVKEHFPKILIELEHSTDDAPEGKFDAHIHFARSRDEMDTRTSAQSNWTCSSCDFSNYSTRSKCKMCGSSQTVPNWQQNLTGVTDAADVPSHILVVYPLAQFVNEDLLAHDMQRLELQKTEPPKETTAGAPKLKSTAPTVDNAAYGARPGSLHRVFLMRDAKTDDTLKYGFAEFWTLEDANAAMAKFRMLGSFSVAACPVTVSNTHMGVFTPVDRPVTPATEHISFHPLFNPDLRVRYRDHHAYPSQKIINPQSPAVEAPAKGHEEEAGDSKKSKKRKADGGLAASAAKKSVPMAGQMAMWQKKHDELYGGQGRADQREPHDSMLDPATQRSSNVSGSLGKASAGGSIKISLSGSKTLDTPTASNTSNTTGAEDGSAPQANDEVESTEKKAEELYMDRDRLMCLICMRKYKSLDEVNIHEKSRNHRTSMENDELVKVALPRLAARDKRMQQAAQDNGTSDSQYRDRAKERRAAYSQPKKPSAQPNKPKADAKPPKQEDTPSSSKPAASKGAGMLAKMGWTAGSGLGANADGRTEVVASNAYQEGVGLGAEGSNLGDAAQLAEKKTKNSYTEYVNTVQDRARERYNKMS